jgi:tagatose 1,6-diphosphate aldolase
MAECRDENRGAPGPFEDGELVLEFVNFAPHPVHKVPTYYFRMVHIDSREEIGGINLRAESNSHIELYAGHVGYTVHPAHRGQRYATRSLLLLIPLARELGLDPLWITCDPDNVASRRSCELAGAKFVEIVDVPETCVIHRSGHTQKCRYRLDLTGLAAT